MSRASSARELGVGDADRVRSPARVPTRRCRARVPTSRVQQRDVGCRSHARCDAVRAERAATDPRGRAAAICRRRRDAARGRAARARVQPRHGDHARPATSARARRRSCAALLRALGWTGRSRARPIRWLNIIRFRAYTSITLIFIGSPIPRMGRRRASPNTSAPTPCAWSNGRSASRRFCRRADLALDARARRATAAAARCSVARTARAGERCRATRIAGAAAR